MRPRVVVGGIGLTVAHTFKKDPQTDDWDRLDRLFDLLW